MRNDDAFEAEHGGMREDGGAKDGIDQHRVRFFARQAGGAPGGLLGRDKSAEHGIHHAIGAGAAAAFERRPPTGRQQADGHAREDAGQATEGTGKQAAAPGEQAAAGDRAKIVFFDRAAQAGANRENRDLVALVAQPGDQRVVERQMTGGAGLRQFIRDKRDAHDVATPGLRKKAFLKFLKVVWKWLFLSGRHSRIK